MDLEKLCSGLFSDSMDSMGYKKQIVKGYSINNRTFSCLGRARTVLLETKETQDENINLGLNFLESIVTGEILVVKGSSKYAYFGELMTRLSERAGINGVVIDGITRDSKYTHINTRLPIIARGYSPVDIKGRGRVHSVDVPVIIKEIKIKPGDLLYFDNDGLAVIPKNIENRVIEDVNHRIKEEEKVTRMIDEGMPVQEMLKTVREF